MDDRFAPFAARMQEDNLPPVVIHTFRHYYHQLAQGQTGLIPERDLDPVTGLPDMAQLGPRQRELGRAARPRTVVIRLNGGLGTSMGLQRAKSLLEIKDGLSFLDIIARQALATQVPLVLMNSFATRHDSLAALAGYPELAQAPLGLDFLQHRFPKVLQSDLSPATSGADPELAWNPPGHGDLYTALVTSGMLARMLAAGLEFAFVANSDNLGAVLDEGLLGYFAEQRLPLLMEVADRTAADRKGGHLARQRDGRLVLRELAQCPAEDLEAFQDVARHRYFNTNSLWLHLPTLAEVLADRGDILGLPLIRNAKHLDPRDPASPAVYQLETAMGSAIGVIPAASAIRVPRTRFSPVKTTNDLLAVRSDAFRLTEDHRVVPAVDPPPTVDLDPRFYRLIELFEARFPAGVPSLVDCTALHVEGDVVFGRAVVLRGAVRLRNSMAVPAQLRDGALLEGSATWP